MHKMWNIVLRVKRKSQEMKREKFIKQEAFLKVKTRKDMESNKNDKFGSCFIRKDCLAFAVGRVWLKAPPRNNINKSKSLWNVPWDISHLNLSMAQWFKGRYESYEGYSEVSLSRSSL